MPIDNFKKAQILNQALPYIREFRGKKMVIKLGGSILDQGINSTLINDLVLMSFVGIKTIIVHGGGKHVSRFLEKLGQKTEFVDGLRITDAYSMEITQMVLAGLINQNLVASIQTAGGNAVGLSGKDTDLVVAAPMKKEGVDLGLVGEVKSVRLDLVDKLLDDAYTPIISSIASDGRGGSLNINADHFATEIAIKLKAEKLIFLSDVPGLLKDPQNQASLISKIKTDQIKPMIQNKEVHGGMIPKLDSAVKSIEQGIRFVHFLSGKVPHSLLVELFTEEGIGTQIHTN